MGLTKIGLGNRGTWLVAACILVGGDANLPAQTIGRPVRFDTAVAVKQLTKRVEPIFPPELVTANPGAVLAADLIVRANGTVESVTVVTSPTGLDPPAPRAAGALSAGA